MKNYIAPLNSSFYIIFVGKVTFIPFNIIRNNILIFYGALKNTNIIPFL